MVYHPNAGDAIIQLPRTSYRLAEYSPVITPPQRQTNGRLYETTQLAIKDYILNQRLGPGDALPTEGRLSQELGISRTSVREAVKALESLGVLETRPGVGLFVRSFSFDPILDNLAYSFLFDRHSVGELLRVRKHLEASFVEEVVASTNPAQLRVLRSAVDRMGERAARDEIPAEFPEEDRFFHRALYAGLNNQFLLKLLDVFWEVYRRLRDEALHVEAIDPVRTWENHRRIVEALERGDGAAARTAMLLHFQGIEDRVRRSEVVGRAPESTD
jgi:DNA-binding FadR family transcriptional regulator